MYVVSCIFGYIVVNCLKLVKDVLNGFHDDWLQSSRERIRIVRIVLFEGSPYFRRFLESDMLLSRLPLKDELGDRKLVAGLRY